MSFKVFLLLCLCIHAFVMSDIIDPSSLRVRRLQTLLKSRGMSPFEIMEKSELVALVHSSGVLSEDELMKSSDWEDSELSEDKYFPRAKTLHKNVELKMCRVWLLYVVPEKTSDVQWKASGQWKMVRQLFKHLGIKTGHSKCFSDNELDKVVIFDPSKDVFDPSLLRVQRLQTLLKSRGMSHVGVTEKSHLVALVHSSGVLSEDELMKSSDWEDSELSVEKYFPTTKLLHMKVAPSLCRVRLVIVVPEKTLDIQWEASDKWKMVRLLFQHLGIETGHSKCYSENEFCGDKQKLKNQMVLVVPRRDERRARCNLEYQSVRPYHSLDSVLEWVQDELATTVNTIESESELENIWMQFNNTFGVLRTYVRVVLILPAANGRIPLFYSSLSMSLENEVSFGVIEQVHAGPLYKHLPPHMATQKHLARYVIITPHGVHEYGSRPNEHLNFKMMKSALETLLVKFRQKKIRPLPIFYLRVIYFVAIDIFLLDFCFVHDLWGHFFKITGVHLIYLFFVWLVVSVLRHIPVVGGLGSFLCELLLAPIKVEVDNIFIMWALASFTLILIPVVTLAWFKDKRQILKQMTSINITGHTGFITGILVPILILLVMVLVLVTTDLISRLVSAVVILVLVTTELIGILVFVVGILVSAVVILASALGILMSGVFIFVLVTRKLTSILVSMVFMLVLVTRKLSGILLSAKS